MATGTAKYRDLDKDVFVQRNTIAQTRPTGGSSVDYWKPKPAPTGQVNKYKIRILPPHIEMPSADPFVETKMHFSLGPDPDPKKRVAITCLTPYGEECPACTHVNRLYEMARQQDDEAETKRLKDQAYDQSAKLRVFANIVDIDHPDRGVQRYAFGPEIEKMLRACFFDDDGEFRNITHPETGRNIIMHVTTKANTKFPEYTVVRAAESATKLQDMDWLDGITNLGELVVRPTREEIENALKGVRPQTPARPSGTASAPKSAARPATPAPAPAAAAAPVPVAEPVVQETKQPAKSKRQAVAEEPSDPWAAARAAIAEKGLSIKLAELTPEEVVKVKKPPCFEAETDPTDDMCKSCRVLLPCYEGFLKKSA